MSGKVLLRDSNGDPLHLEAIKFGSMSNPVDGDIQLEGGGDCILFNGHLAPTGTGKWALGSAMHHCSHVFTDRIYTQELDVESMKVISDKYAGYSQYATYYYFELPNGVKVCWGRDFGLKEGATEIPLPVTYWHTESFIAFAGVYSNLSVFTNPLEVGANSTHSILIHSHQGFGGGGGLHGLYWFTIGI